MNPWLNLLAFGLAFSAASFSFATACEPILASPKTACFYLTQENGDIGLGALSLHWDSFLSLCASRCN
jgi:hypothetical protein